MNRHLKLFFLIILLAGCQKITEDFDKSLIGEAGTIRFDRETEVSKFHAGRFRDLAVTPEALFLLYADSNGIVKTDHDFNAIKKISGSGYGPGEFVDPSRIATLPEHIIVCDFRKWSLEIFDHQLNHKTTILLEKQPWQILGFKDSTIIVSFTMGSHVSIAAITILDFNDFNIDKRTLFTRESSYPAAGAGIPVRTGDRFYYVGNYLNEIIKFNLADGKTGLSEFSFFPDKAPLIHRFGIQVPGSDLMKSLLMHDNRMFLFSGTHVSEDQYVLEIDGQWNIRSSHRLDHWIIAADHYQGTAFGYNPETETLYAFKLPERNDPL